jgi:hypothetical protein
MLVVVSVKHWVGLLIQRRASDARRSQEAQGLETVGPTQRLTSSIVTAVLSVSFLWLSHHVGWVLKSLAKKRATREEVRPRGLLHRSGK